MTKPVLTTAEVADMLQCAPETVDAHARAGTLLGVKFGVSWVFPVEPLIESVNALARAKAAERHQSTKPRAVQSPVQAPVQAMPQGRGRARSVRPSLVGLG